MSGEYIVFLFLAFFSVMGGTIMLISKKVMHMMVAMIFTFISIAGIFILLSAEFIAAVQVMVYSGAVAIIMIVISLIKPKSEKDSHTIEMDKSVFNVSTGFVIGSIIICGILAALYTVYW